MALNNSEIVTSSSVLIKALGKLWDSHIYRAVRYYYSDRKDVLICAIAILTHLHNTVCEQSMNDPNKLQY